MRRDGTYLFLLGLLLGVACGPQAAPEERAPAGARSEAELDALCEGIHNSLECAEAIERAQLPADERARRSGDTLLLDLASGDTSALVDRAGPPAEVIHHTYRRRWREPDYFVVHRQYYEGSDYLLVHGATGAETAVPDVPLLSPDRRRFAVLSLDLVAGYSTNTLQVWRLTDAGPELEWETEPEDWGAEDGEWRAPDRMRFTRACGPDPAGDPACGQRQELVREGADWTVRPVPDGGP